jgi:ankyrin repeat protein
VARPRLTFDIVEEVRNTTPQFDSIQSYIRVLILCRRHDLSDPSNPSVQELLFVAIMLRHVEVVEELRSRNPNLVIQSAPVTSERQSLTGRIVRKLIATGSQAAVTVGFLAILWAAEQLQKDPEVRQEAEEVLKAVVDWVYLMDHPVDQQGNTPLMYAVRSNNVTAVSVLLEKGVDFRVINSHGDNAFSIANHRGYYSIAERILQESRRRGCRLPPETLRDALGLALRLNMQDMIKAILLNDANNDFAEKIDATPAAIDIFFYPQTGDLSMDPINSESRRPGPSVDPNLIQMVIDHGTPVAPEDVLPVVLKMAVELAKSEWIRHLHSLQAHDVINWVNKHRIIRILLERYPLSDRRETADSFLESLLDIGASVHPADLGLDLLTRPSLRVMVAILGKTKPAINEYIPYDSWGTLIQQLLDNSSVHGTAAEQNMWLEALLAAGCDPNQTSLWEWRSVTNAGGPPPHLLTYTPFQLACARSQFCSAPSGYGYVRADPIYYSDQLPLILLRGGAAPWGRVSSWKQTFPGAPPLVLACLTGKLEVVEAILKLEPYSDNPAQLLRRFEHWHIFGTPLQAACLWFGQRDDDPDVSVRLVKTLLAAGDKVTFSSLPCGSPLIAATFSLLPEVVEVLLAAGADPTIPEPVNVLINSQFRINAWEALEPWNEMFVEFLVSHFNSFQTGNFTCGPRRDAASNEQRRERIRELFSLYRPSPSRGVYQQIPIGLDDPSTDDRDDKLDDAFDVFPLGMPATKPSMFHFLAQFPGRPKG